MYLNTLRTDVDDEMTGGISRAMSKMMKIWITEKDTVVILIAWKIENLGQRCKLNLFTP